MKESAFARRKATGVREISPSFSTANEFEVLRAGRREDVDGDAPTSLIGPTTIERLTKDAVVVHLHAVESVVVLGVFDVTVKHGSIEVLGARINGEKNGQSYRVYGPRSHALPVITGLGTSSYGKKTANSVIISSAHGGMRDFHMFSDAFNDLWDVGTDEKLDYDLGSKPSFSILGYHLQYDRKYRKSLIPFQVKQQWLSTVNDVSSLPTGQERLGRHILICGPKNSGKSTMTRYLANTLLSPVGTDSDQRAKHSGVAILDIDPGQPEFGPPGTLSLVHVRSPILGPSYTHPLEHALLGIRKDAIIRQHFLASTTPRASLATYIECVLNLIATYKKVQEQYPRCHLLINASGWITGEGLHLFHSIFAETLLTNVVYMSDTGPQDVLDYLHQQCEDRQVRFSLVRTQVSASSRSASTLRQMQYQSYFHLKTAETINHVRWNPSETENKGRPLTLRYAGDGQNFHGFVSFGRRLDQQQVVDHFHGKLVGIVVLDSLDALSVETVSSRSMRRDTHLFTNSWEASEDFDDGSSKTPIILYTEREQIPYILTETNKPIKFDPWKSQCAGLAMVQSIKRETQTISLQTPVTWGAIQGLVNPDQKMVILVDMEVASLNWIQQDARSLRLKEQELQAWGVPASGMPYNQGSEARVQYPIDAMEMENEAHDVRPSEDRHDQL